MVKKKQIMLINIICINLAIYDIIKDTSILERKIIINQYISDIIKDTSILEWRKGESIFISAPTGSGKSHFVKNKLYDHFSSIGYKILLMSNRKLLKQQNDNEIGSDADFIDTINYQYIESGNSSFFNKYDVLVFDEVHYILNDAMFNRNTDMFLDFIKNTPKDKICIFITATPDAIFSIRKNYNYLYTLDSNYSYIKNVYFYHKQETLNVILDSIPNNEKCIYFCSNILEAYELSLKYNNSAFLCSEYHSGFFKKSSKDERENIVRKEKFNSKYLFTTKVLDNGINIKDSSVKHIIIDMLDPITFVQCLGRKRILDESDEVTVYVRNYHGGQLSAHSKNLSQKIKLANELLNIGEIEFAKKYKKTILDSVIDTDLQINWAKYYSYKYFQSLYYNLVIDEDKIGYKKYICKQLNFDIENSQSAESVFFKSSMKGFLDKWENIEMYKEDQEKFKNEFFGNIFNTRGANCRTRGLKSINAILEEENLNYVIGSKQCRESCHRGKTYWRLVKI